MNRKEKKYKKVQKNHNNWPKKMVEMPLEQETAKVRSFQPEFFLPICIHFPRQLKFYTIVHTFISFSISAGGILKISPEM